MKELVSEKNDLSSRLTKLEVTVFEMMKNKSLI